MPAKRKKNICEVCGKEQNSDGDIWHRGCRLKRAFPDCYERKDGLLFFDAKKIAKKIKEMK